MDNLIIPISAMADLEKGIRKTYLDMLFVTNDNEAHRVDVQLWRGKNPQELGGAGVSAYFIRYSDNATIPLTGEASGNVVSVKMKRACYNKPGQFALIIKATIGGVTSTVFYGEGAIFVSSTEKVLDDEDIIPTLDDLLAQIAAMESASSRANTAADRVERMQIDASGLAGDANRLGGKPLEAFFAVNQLDNSDWRTKENIVNQRGKTSYTGAGYTIDRWESWGTDVVTTIEDGCLSITSPQAHGIKQTVEGDYTGKVLTLAVCDSDGNVKCSYATVPAKTTTTQYMFAVTFGSSAVYLYVTSQGLLTVQFNVASNSIFRVKWVALYEGSYTADTLPPFVPKGYGAELAECQRYYFKAASDAGIYGYIGGNGTTAYVFIPLPVAMRLPNVSLDGSTNLTVVFNGLNIVVTTFTAQTARLNQLELKFTFETAKTPLTPITGWINHCSVSADL